jgi:hypothetical protein
MISVGAVGLLHVEAETVQVGGDAWVCELCRPRVVVDEVNPARGGVTDFPPGGQRAEVALVDLEVTRYTGIVPGGDTCLRVKEVDLSLLSRPLLVAVGQRHRFVQLSAAHVVPMPGHAWMP